jgi:hypothetical protein
MRRELFRRSDRLKERNGKLSSRDSEDEVSWGTFVFRGDSAA